MKPRPDLLDKASPAGIEVFQLTDDPDVPSCHVYMEAQVFSPDSRRFVLHRSAHPHGSDADDAKHQYLLCDLDDGGRLTPLTNEPGVTAPSVSPDGSCMYYFVNQTGCNNRLTLKQVNLDGSRRTTIKVLDGQIAGQKCRLSKVYPLSTISSDGRRLALACTVDEDQKGVMVFDLGRATVELVLRGPLQEWANTHPQYCRSTDPRHSHDIMIQHHHGMVSNPPGPHKLIRADIHVIRDDGTNFRSFPWGMDDVEYQQGHQCWRGTSPWAVSSTVTRVPGADNPERTECQLIEAQALTHPKHLGRGLPNARRNDLSRDFCSDRGQGDDRRGGPQFYHFCIDRQGETIVTDYWYPHGNPFDPQGRTFLYAAHLGQPGKDAARNFTYLLDTGIRPGRRTHPHPCLSPDGRTVLFNSDETGTVQAYMVCNLPTP